MLSMRWNRFPVCSACDEISSPYAQCAIKFVPRMLSMDCTCKNVHILQLAEHARKFVPRMLSMRWNWFRVCSACDKIVSAYAQHTHAIIFENDSKIPNLTFFAETESLWSQGPVTRDFWKSYSIRTRYSTFKHFRACSACDEIGSQYAQHAMKLVPRMLSVR